MYQPDDHIISILYRRASGVTLTPEDQSIFDKWYEQYHPLLEKVPDEVELMEIGQYRRDAKDSWQRLMDKHQRINRKRTPMWWRVAAVFVVLIGSGVFLIPSRKQPNNASIASNSDSNYTLYKELTTSTGKKDRVVLPDGSLVILNAGSQLRYPPVFSGGKRQVFLSGEAYFEVRPNSSQPFIVLVNNQFPVRVIGTHFNINAYTDEPEMKVTLVNGELRLGPGQNAPRLAPGEQARIVRQLVINIEKVPQLAIDESVLWTRDTLFFERASIRDVMRSLGRWYPMEIRYKDSIVGRQIVRLSPISTSVPLSEVLRRLEKAEALHYQIDGQQVTLSEFK